LKKAPVSGIEYPMTHMRVAVSSASTALFQTGRMISLYSLLSQDGGTKSIEAFAVVGVNSRFLVPSLRSRVGMTMERFVGD
jgi:hypothetical protein